MSQATLPTAFLEHIHRLLGTATEDFVRSHAETAPVSLRLHPVKGSGLFDDAARIPWCGQGRYLSSRPSFTLDPYFQGGAYYVQEAGSMLTGFLLSPLIDAMESPLILDACAAPGGKSTHLLSMLDGKGTLISNEVIPQRNKVLQHNINKWGYANSIVVQNEATSLRDSGLKFDVVVVDAPCSGEGLFRKDPEAVQEWSPEQVLVCANRQQQLLEALTPAVKEGGYLLYSTCTFQPAENDLQVEKLVRSGAFVSCMPADVPEGIVLSEYGWQAFPHKVSSEGFYCALLRKTRGDSTCTRSEKSAPGMKFKQAASLLKQPDRFMYSSHEQLVSAMPRHTYDILSALRKNCYIRQAGLTLGEEKGVDFIPSAALALSIDLQSASYPHIDCELSDALDFLRAGSPTFTSSVRGWHLIKYKAVTLGWAKNLGTRWNNYFPKSWRIVQQRNG